MTVKFAPMEVQYVDHMGGDVNVVNAARVSFAKVVKEFDEDRDSKLINYLAKHNHFTPLAHTSVSIRVKAPIFMARQFVKHQVGLVWNEESRRYIDDEPEFFEPDEWRTKPDNAKQGSGEETVDKRRLFIGDFEDCPEAYSFTGFCQFSLNLYRWLLMNGTAPEQARMVLPQNTMTNWVWTGSLVAFARVCKLRLDPHAQKEAQELAQKIHDVVAPLYPVSWDALMTHMKV